MKILMLNYEFPPIGGGGGQAHLALLQQYARRPELEVDVLTCAPQPGLVVEPFAGNVNITKVGIRKRDLHLWRRAEVLDWLRKAKPPYRRLLAAKDYDLVHAFFGFPTGWLCYRTARKLPYVISLRGSDVPGENARLKLDYRVLGPLVFRPIWKKAAALVACSEGLKARALQFLPSAAIEVIPNGVDLERFQPPDPDARRGRGDWNVLRLLTVGRLSATKRLPLLIEAVELLAGRGAKVSLTIVGGGALESELRRLLSAKRDLRNTVTLTGRRKAGAMPKVYQQHDVFISASMQEGMSNAMLEAMASGLPIVTTRCEGVAELIADNGLVVEDPQPAALAAALDKLAHDRTTLKAMSRAARRRAEAFSWSEVAESYLRLYAKVK
jgi:glycosyltransferase involved in cell wall biosynthesis